MVTPWVAVRPRRWLFLSDDGVCGSSGRVLAAARGGAPSLLSVLPDKLPDVFSPWKKGTVVSNISFGDSYALGMAGTGGTSS